MNDKFRILSKAETITTRTPFPFILISLPCVLSLVPQQVTPAMKKAHAVNKDDATIRIGEEEEDEDDLAGLVMDDEGDVRLQRLFHDGDDGNKEEESNDIGINTSGNDSRKRRRLEERKQVLIHEDAILDCFHLAIASHNTPNSHQPSIIKQKSDDDEALAKSTTSTSDSFRWRPPLLYATTTETDTTDTSAAGTLADWQPQPLELPLWALALVRPSSESLNKQPDKQE